MATKKTGASGKAAPLEAKVADKLLDLLGADNEFRRLFKKDPGAALEQVGYPPDMAARLGHCSQVEHIASKAEIMRSRTELKQQLTSFASQTVVFCFESGKVAQSLRLK
jgi:putative modified peptide